MKWQWTIPPEAPLIRADKLLLVRFAELSDEEGAPALTRSQLQRLMEEGRVLADGTPIDAGQRLKPGQKIELEIPPPEKLGIEPEARDLDILFQDEHLLVVNKPPGLTVHPSETQKTGTLVHALLHHIQDLSGIGGVLRPGIVHRIDKDTSGALVIAKSDEAHVKLSEIFARHDIERAYWALVYGDPPLPRTGEKRIETLIARNPKDRLRMSSEVKEGKQAITRLRLIEAYGLPDRKPFASLVEARLETGRTHQVRVHLTGLGNSLLGDPLYGQPSSSHTKWTALPSEVQDHVSQLVGQALHARVLGFRHPITGENLRFEAAPPAGFQLLLDTLRTYR